MTHDEQQQQICQVCLKPLIGAGVETVSGLVVHDECTSKPRSKQMTSPDLDEVAEARFLLLEATDEQFDAWLNDEATSEELMRPSNDLRG